LKAVVFLFFCISFLFAQDDAWLYQKYLSRSKAVKDINTLSAWLRNHPGMNLYEDSAGFRDFIQNKIIPELPDSIEIRAFRRLLKKVVRYVHCGHTDVQLPFLYLYRFFKNHPPLIPFTAKSDDSIACVTGLHPGVTHLLKFGDTILSVNGVSVNDIIHQNLDLFTWDGYLTKSGEYHARNMLHQLIQMHLNYPKEYTLIVVRFGKPDTIVVSALIDNQKVRYKLHRLKDTLFRLGNSPGIQYYFSKDSTQTWAYLKIERFTGNNFASELNHALRKISKHKKKVLILDLRNNGGGRILLAENLLSRLYPYYPDEYVFYKKKNIGFPKKAVIFPLPYRIIQWCLPLYFRKETRNDTVWYKRNIKKKKPVPFRQIYVLSNYGTFSAASFVTARLQRDANAIVVGEETGGTAGGCNAVIILPCRLPESRIKVFFPLYRFCNSSSSCRDDGKGVKPDILIKTKISDRFAGRDRVLEQVIKIIQKNP